jgi:serralysin
MIQVCIPRRPPTNPPPPGVAEMAALRGTLWHVGQELTIAFDSTSVKRERVAVLKACAIWEEVANISFRSVVSNSADLRCAFDMGDGSWSYVGNECASIPKGRPTMNMGWLDDPGRDLHELGHALGLVHEHQWGHIPWNRPAVYAYYGAPPNSWSPQMVDQQVLQEIPVSQLDVGTWDRRSVMMYPVPAELLTDPSYSAGINQVLSTLDKQKIAKLYPKK